IGTAPFAVLDNFSHLVGIDVVLATPLVGIATSLVALFPFLGGEAHKQFVGPTCYHKILSDSYSFWPYPLAIVPNHNHQLAAHDDSVVED
ncbi:hypothetical protein PIB30_101111, partial [Stylosanthes scabra]|nr:hypothetical protein [Stylosanthes scabra]